MWGWRIRWRWCWPTRRSRRRNSSAGRRRGFPMAEAAIYIATAPQEQQHDYCDRRRAGRCRIGPHAGGAGAFARCALPGRQTAGPWRGLQIRSRSSRTFCGAGLSGRATGLLRADRSGRGKENSERIEKWRAARRGKSLRASNELRFEPQSHPREFRRCHRQEKSAATNAAGIGRTNRAPTGDASHAAVTLLSQQESWRAAGSVLFYAPLGNELDIWPAVALALVGGKVVCLPRFDESTQSYVACRVEDLQADLREGRYGIREPLQRCNALALNRLDFALVPWRSFRFTWTPARPRQRVFRPVAGGHERENVRSCV